MIEDLAVRCAADLDCGALEGTWLLYRIDQRTPAAGRRKRILARVFLPSNPSGGVDAHHRRPVGVVARGLLQREEAGVGGDHLVGGHLADDGSSL